MRASPDGAAAAPASTVSLRRPGPAALVGAAAAGLGAVSVLFGAGPSDARLALIGLAAWTAAGIAFAAVAWAALPRPALAADGLVAVLFFAGWVVWGGVTLLWSIEPDRSWDVLNRGLVYLAALALGALAGTVVPRAPRVAAWMLAGVIGVALAWALLGKVVPALDPDVDRSARLRGPVGYWNALALLLAVSLPLWSWIAARRAHDARVRALGVVALFLSFVALALTASRGGVLVALVAVAVWLAIGASALESAVALALAAVTALPVAAWALERDGLTEAGAADSVRTREGAWLGVLLLVGSVALWVVALAAARAEERLAPSESQRRRASRVAVAAAAGVVVVAVVVGTARVGDPVVWADERLDEFRNPPSVQVSQGSERLGQFSSNHRWTWWSESWLVWRDNPVLGTGAGSFALARLPIREDTQRPLEPHNLAVQALAETGAVGFLLLLGFGFAAAWVVAGRLRGLEGAERAAAAALAAGLVAYAAHALIDVGYDYVAVSAPFFLVLGVLLVGGRAPEAARGRRPVAAFAIALVTLTVAASLLSPWLADRRLDASLDRSLAGDLAGAERAAEQARSLNPLALQPILAEASLAEGAGRLDEAEELYRDGVRLQPQNPETWYQLGRFRFEARDDPEGALVLLDRSYALDAYHAETPALLNVVRAALAAG
jgi:O-Antigen ligase/Tetratricopeptide repeat